MTSGGPGPSPGAATAVAGDRLLWVDQLRGASVLLVVAFHATTLLARVTDDDRTALVVVTRLFAPYRMPLLMFLSGLLLARSLRKPARTFLRGKLAALGWPYLLWSLVTLVVTRDLDADTVLRVAWSPPTVMWFLWFLLAYYLGAWVLHRLGVPLLVALLVGVVGSFGPEAYRFSRFWFLLVFFIGGHLVESRWLAREATVRPSTRRWLLVATAPVVVLGGVASAAGVEVQYRPLWTLVPACGVVLALLLAPLTGAGPTGRALARVGRDSVVYYVTHFAVTWVALWWLARAGVTDVAWLFVGGLATALVVGALLARLRPHPLVAALFAFPRRPPRTA